MELDQSAHLLAEESGQKSPRFTRYACVASLLLAAIVLVIVAVASPILYFESLDAAQNSFYRDASARGLEVSCFRHRSSF
jgi:hypothetical protein